MLLPNLPTSGPRRHLTKSIRGLLGLDVCRDYAYSEREDNCPAWKSHCGFLHANFLFIFLVCASVNFLKTLHDFKKS